MLGEALRQVRLISGIFFRKKMNKEYVPDYDNKIFR